MSLLEIYNTTVGTPKKDQCYFQEIRQRDYSSDFQGKELNLHMLQGPVGKKACAKDTDIGFYGCQCSCELYKKTVFLNILNLNKEV